MNLRSTGTAFFFTNTYVDEMVDNTGTVGIAGIVDNTTADKSQALLAELSYLKSHRESYRETVDQNYYTKKSFSPSSL